MTGKGIRGPSMNVLTKPSKLRETWEDSRSVVAGVKGGEVGAGLAGGREEGELGSMGIRCRSSLLSFSKLVNPSSVWPVRPKQAGFCHSNHALSRTLS